MRLTVLALALLVLCPIVPAQASGDWHPTLPQVRDLERQMAGTPASDFATRQRYYSGVTEGGHRLMRGVLVGISSDGRPRPGIRLGMPDPMISDGGCGVVTVTYDPRRHKVLDASCNGQG